jgi:hypothetical protein
MKLFWLILIFAILFVVGSATALNALGRTKKPDAEKKPEKDNKA